MPDDLDDAAPPLVDQLARANVKARLGIAPAEATRVGRFAILGPIGAGGMGVVYSAYDDELARKVAIKLVRPGRNDPDIQARSRREAQALARLSHPNVVQVYEVGEYMGQVYVAMEYIQGKTLRAWQSSQPRSWREVVAMYRQVGLGLAAAHARGLVHRDFKPDNVLVGDDDQRPRVLDFGLARVRTRDSTPDLAPIPYTPLETDPPRSAPAAHLSEGPPPEDLSEETPPASGRPSLAHLSAEPPPATSMPPAAHLSEETPPATSRPPTAHLSAEPPPATSMPPAAHLSEETPSEIARPPSAHSPRRQPRDPSTPSLDSTLLAAPGHTSLDSTLLAAPGHASVASTLLATPDSPSTPRRPPAPRHLSEEPAPDSPRFAVPPAPADARLTVPGAVLGTPAYMAPEQLAGGEADARSDVFSFCVALYEALLRIRPFPGDRSDTLLAAVQRGELARPERPPDIPAWLLRVVERGLTADPGARWPAMDPLLAALARDPTRLRRRLAVTVLALGLAALAVVGLLDWQDRRRSEARAVERAAEQARTADAEAAAAQARTAADSERQRNEAHRLAQSAAQVAGTDPTLGLLLAIEAVRVHHDAGAPPTLEAAQALRDALGNVTSVPFSPPGAPEIVDAVAESPDGAWLATGQRSGAVTLWSTADPRSPHTLLPADAHPVRALEFSSTRLAVLRDEPGGPRVWTLPSTPVPEDINNIKPVRWDSPEDDLHDLAWNPDGAALLTRAGAVALILRANAPPRVLAGHTAPVRRAVWSPDGRVLTTSGDLTARMWPADGGPPSVQRLLGSPTAAAVAPDSRTHIVAVDRQPVQTIGIGFDREHHPVLANSDGTLHTLDDEEQPRYTHMREVLGAVRFAPGADLFLGTPDGGAVYLWQRARPGDPLVLHGHRASVVTARFSADGQRILTGSADGSARRWHILDDPAVLRGHDAGIEHASFAGDARRVVTAAMDGTVRVWPRDGRPAKILTGHREGSSVRALFSPDGARLATAGSDGLARLWSLTDPVPTLLATLPGERERGPSIVALAWHPRGDLLAFAGDDGRVHLVHATPGRPVRTDILTGPTTATTALAFNHADRLAAAGDDGVVRVWTLADPPVLTDSFTGHTAPIRDLAFAGPRLASASEDASVRVWTHAAAPALLAGHRGAVAQVRVHPDGTTLLTASADGTARIWPQDADSIVLTGHADALWLAAWSPDGREILTASADGSARLWSQLHDAWHGVLLPQQGAPGASDPALWTGGFSPDGRLALVAGADALARVFPVTLADQLSTACTRAGRDLDPAAWARTMGDRPHRPTCP